MRKEERQGKVAERRRNWDRHRERRHIAAQRHRQEKGKCLPSCKGYLSVWGWPETAVGRAGGNLSSGFKWPIDHRSPPFLQSNVDVQITQSARREVAGPPATQDNPNDDLQLRRSTSRAVGKALECGPRTGERRMRSGIVFGGKQTKRQTLTRRTEKICRGETFPCGVAHLPPFSLVSSTQMCALALKLLRVSLRHYRFNDYLY